MEAKGSAKAPSDSGGQATPSTGNGKSSYALYCIGTVESSLQWDSVELANMQGIGIAQWSFDRRLDVLNAMKTADPTGYETFAETCPEIAALMGNGGTFTRPLTPTESAAFKAWAQRAESHQGNVTSSRRITTIIHRSTRTRNADTMGVGISSRPGIRRGATESNHIGRLIEQSA